MPVRFFEHASGRLPKWPTGADCKSAGLRLRWFESITYHHFFDGAGPLPSINQKTGADTLSRLLYHGHASNVASLMPGRQESGKVNAEEGAGDRDEAGDGKMSDLASGRLAENDSTDPGGDTGRQLLKMTGSRWGTGGAASAG